VSPGEEVGIREGKKKVWERKKGRDRRREWTGVVPEGVVREANGDAWAETP